MSMENENLNQNSINQQTLEDNQQENQQNIVGPSQEIINSEFKQKFLQQISSNINFSQVDPIQFQANIPNQQENTQQILLWLQNIKQQQQFNSHLLSQQEIDDYLQMAAQICGYNNQLNMQQHSTNRFYDSGLITTLDENFQEHALNFLHQMNYSIKKAKFYLIFPSLIAFNQFQLNQGRHHCQVELSEKQMDEQIGQYLTKAKQKQVDKYELWLQEIQEMMGQRIHISKLHNILEKGKQLKYEISDYIKQQFEISNQFSKEIKKLLQNKNSIGIMRQYNERAQKIQIITQEMQQLEDICNKCNIWENKILEIKKCYFHKKTVQLKDLYSCVVEYSSLSLQDKEVDEVFVQLCSEGMSILEKINSYRLSNTKTRGNQEIQKMDFNEALKYSAQIERLNLYCDEFAQFQKNVEKSHQFFEVCLMTFEDSNTKKSQTLFLSILHILENEITFKLPFQNMIQRYLDYLKLLEKIKKNIKNKNKIEIVSNQLEELKNKQFPQSEEVETLQFQLKKLKKWYKKFNILFQARTPFSFKCFLLHRSNQQIIKSNDLIPSSLLQYLLTPDASLQQLIDKQNLQEVQEFSREYSSYFDKRYANNYYEKIQNIHNISQYLEFLSYSCEKIHYICNESLFKNIQELVNIYIWLLNANKLIKSFNNNFVSNVISDQELNLIQSSQENNKNSDDQVQELSNLLQQYQAQQIQNSIFYKILSQSEELSQLQRLFNDQKELDNKTNLQLTQASLKLIELLNILSNNQTCSQFQIDEVQNYYDIINQQLEKSKSSIILSNQLKAKLTYTLELIEWITSINDIINNDISLKDDSENNSQLQQQIMIKEHIQTKIKNINQINNFIQWFEFQEDKFSNISKKEIKNQLKNQENIMNEMIDTIATNKIQFKYFSQFGDLQKIIKKGEKIQQNIPSSIQQQFQQIISQYVQQCNITSNWLNIYEQIFQNININVKQEIQQQQMQQIYNENEHNDTIKNIKIENEQEKLENIDNSVNSDKISNTHHHPKNYKKLSIYHKNKAKQHKNILLLPQILIHYLNALELKFVNNEAMSNLYKIIVKVHTFKKSFDQIMPDNFQINQKFTLTLDQFNKLLEEGENCKCFLINLQQLKKLQQWAISWDYLAQDFIKAVPQANLLSKKEIIENRKKFQILPQDFNLNDCKVIFDSLDYEINITCTKKIKQQNDSNKQSSQEKLRIMGLLGNEDQNEIKNSCELSSTQEQENSVIENKVEKKKRRKTQISKRLNDDSIQIFGNKKHSKLPILKKLKQKDKIKPNLNYKNDQSQSSTFENINNFLKQYRIAQKGGQIYNVNHDQQENLNQQFCICRQWYDDQAEMTECDICKNWFHIECLGIKQSQISKLNSFYCFACLDVFNLADQSQIDQLFIDYYQNKYKKISKQEFEEFFEDGIKIPIMFESKEYIVNFNCQLVKFEQNIQSIKQKPLNVLIQEICSEIKEQKLMIENSSSRFNMFSNKSFEFLYSQLFQSYYFPIDYDEEKNYLVKLIKKFIIIYNILLILNRNPDIPLPLINENGEIIYIQSLKQAQQYYEALLTNCIVQENQEIVGLVNSLKQLIDQTIVFQQQFQNKLAERYMVQNIQQFIQVSKESKYFFDFKQIQSQINEFKYKLILCVINKYLNRKCEKEVEILLKKKFKTVQFMLFNEKTKKLDQFPFCSEIYLKSYAIEAETIQLLQRTVEYQQIMSGYNNQDISKANQDKYQYLLLTYNKLLKEINQNQWILPELKPPQEIINPLQQSNSTQQQDNNNIQVQPHYQQILQQQPYNNNIYYSSSQQYFQILQNQHYKQQKEKNFIIQQKDK